MQIFRETQRIRIRHSAYAVPLEPRTSNFEPAPRHLRYHRQQRVADAQHPPARSPLSTRTPTPQPRANQLSRSRQRKRNLRPAQHPTHLLKLRQRTIRRIHRDLHLRITARRKHNRDRLRSGVQIAGHNHRPANPRLRISAASRSAGWILSPAGRDDNVSLAAQKLQLARLTRRCKVARRQPLAFTLVHRAALTKWPR